MPLAKASHGEVTLTKTYKDPRYFTSVYFNEGYFTEDKTIIFTIPRWMKVELKEYNFEDHGIKKSTLYDAKADADVITYTIQNVTAYKKEAAAPGRSYVYPHLLVMCKEANVNGGKVVFFNTLADQYSWYRHLVLNVNDDKTVLLEKAKELTANITNDKEKIKAVF
ncbi:MAG: hypothetical protein WDN26_14665 [Chitinophagaceae bacterium]